MAGKRITVTICPDCHGAVVRPDSLELHIQHGHPGLYAMLDQHERQAAAAERARIRAVVEALSKVDDWNVVVRRDAVLAAIDGAGE